MTLTPKKVLKWIKNREIIKKIEQDRCYLVKITGDHHHFKHLIKRVKVTVPHPKKDIPIKTLISIEKQAQLKLR